VREVVRAGRAVLVPRRGEQIAPGVSRRELMRCVASEVPYHSSSHPHYWSFTVVMLADEDGYEVLQAMITVFDGSPYSWGCFIFDIYLLPMYPNTPPKLKLLTTGGKRVRFNPNLSASGKVCVWLGGTWAGPS
jgi:ubiquitin-protein ligase